MSAVALARNLSLFAALSLSDLGLTGYLLSRNGGAYESNPVAAWWLEQFGWIGLVGFKLATFGLAIIVVVAVARRSPRAARLVLRFGCTTLLAVLVYSSLLVPGVHADAEFAGYVAAQHQELEQNQRRQKAYAVVVRRLANDLLAGQRSLAEAVQNLASEDEVHVPYWFERMSERFPSYTMREMLAIRLMMEAIEFPRMDADRAARLARALGVQFEASFGRPAPRISPKHEGSDGEMTT